MPDEGKGVRDQKIAVKRQIQGFHDSTSFFLFLYYTTDLVHVKQYSMNFENIFRRWGLLRIGGATMAVRAYVGGGYGRGRGGFFIF
jgi:hypothetical protein